MDSKTSGLAAAVYLMMHFSSHWCKCRYSIVHSRHCIWNFRVLVYIVTKKIKTEHMLLMYWNSSNLIKVLRNQIWQELLLLLMKEKRFGISATLFTIFFTLNFNVQEDQFIMFFLCISTYILSMRGQSLDLFLIPYMPLFLVTISSCRSFQK